MARSERPGPANTRLLGPVWTRTRALVGASPLVLSLVRRLGRAKSDQLVGPGTQICIEGYPRSANTFMGVAFQMADPSVRRRITFISAAS